MVMMMAIALSYFFFLPVTHRRSLLLSYLSPAGTLCRRSERRDSFMASLWSRFTFFQVSKPAGDSLPKWLYAFPWTGHQRKTILSTSSVEMVLISFCINFSTLLPKFIEIKGPTWDGVEWSFCIHANWSDEKNKHHEVNNWPKQNRKEKFLFSNFSGGSYCVEKDNEIQERRVLMDFYDA